MSFTKLIILRVFITLDPLLDKNHTQVLYTRLDQLL